MFSFSNRRTKENRVEESRERAAQTDSLRVYICAKSKLENGHLSARWRRFMAGSLKKSVVCGNHSDVPVGSKQPPCQHRPLCGLFTLRAIPDSTRARRRARHTDCTPTQNMCRGDPGQLKHLFFTFSFITQKVLERH